MGTDAPEYGTAEQNRTGETDALPRLCLSAAIEDILIEYSLYHEVVSGVTFHSVTVSARFPDGTSECVVLPELTSDRKLAESILYALRDGAVTPCAAAGIADDMLAAAVTDPTLQR